MLRPRLVVFLKEPRPGLVKTRLARTIGEEAAANLCREMTRDTLEWAANLDGFALTVLYAPAGAEESCRALLEGPLRGNVTLAPQSDGDLGERLARAAESAGRDANGGIILIGTDCPLLGPEEVIEAAARLAESDVVLGPACDGGYYLIALRRPEVHLFAGVPWSTEQVLATTLARAEASGLRTACLHPLRDLDTAADLPSIRAELITLWHSARDGASDRFPRRTFRALEWIARGA